MSNLKVLHLHVIFCGLVAHLRVHLSALNICLVEGRGPTTFFLSFYRNGIGSLYYPPCGWRH